MATETITVRCELCHRYFTVPREELDSREELVTGITTDLNTTLYLNHPIIKQITVHYNIGEIVGDLCPSCCFYLFQMGLKNILTEI